jgi:hypothetical protein
MSGGMAVAMADRRMALRPVLLLPLALALAPGCGAGALETGDEGGDDGAAGGADAAVDDSDLARDATVVVDLGQLGRTLPADFVGLSLEYPLVGRYLGREPAQLKPAFQRLLGNLGARTLRIGGGTTDTSCWRTSAGASLPAGCAIEISGNALRVIAATMQKTGWRAILGVDLNHYSPATALDYARDGVAVAFATAASTGSSSATSPTCTPPRAAAPPPTTTATSSASGRPTPTPSGATPAPRRSASSARPTARAPPGSISCPTS